MVVCAMVSGGEISGRVEVPCRASAVEATTSGDENEAVFGSLDTGGGAAPSPASSMASSDLDRQPEGAGSSRAKWTSTPHACEVDCAREGLQRW